MSRDSGEKLFDVAIVGAGVLGVTIAYWLSQLYDCSIALIDQASGVAFHTSTRNTGVIHRPFYLNPDTKKVFAVSAELSYPLWHDLANRFSLPWRQVGTLEVALSDENVSTLEKYRSWGLKNGMQENELELLDDKAVRAIEPEVSCRGAIYSKTDVSVDFGAFTKSVYGMAESRGVKFLGCQEVESMKSLEDGSHLLSFKPGGVLGAVACRFLINAAGGGSVDIAHMEGIGEEYTDLHFRGDYWLVDEPFASRVGTNIYSVARHSQFPFLDPHFVVRADGSRQIGPNAALVSGPFAYEGLGKGFIRKLIERPISPKLRLFTNGTFLSLIWTEWRSSVSKTAMCDRVRQFLPQLDASSLNTRGLSGVRSSLIDSRGFVPEALQLEGRGSFHILNFNSPGATGAPIFSAMVVRRLKESGVLGFLSERRSPQGVLWDFDDATLRLDRLGRVS